jgi:GTP-binding protein
MPHPSPKTRFLTSYADPSALPAEGLPQVAFLGRSNAGKSSLINSLTGVDLARVSGTPGRTRLINLFEVDGRYHLVDLPGYGFAAASKMEREKLAELIHGYLGTSELLRLAVVIVDSRLGPTDSDRDMIESLSQSGIPFLLVSNKADKLSRTELSQSMASMRANYPGASVIAHSAVTGAGRGEIAEAIRKILSAAV